MSKSGSLIFIVFPCTSGRVYGVLWANMILYQVYFLS